MSKPMPLLFQWTGEAMVPSNIYAAERQYAPGERYRLAVHEERSAASHAHYFAAIHDAWANLSDELQQRFPSPEHLRKFALIKSGYCNSVTKTFFTARDAKNAAAIARPLDEFALVVVEQNIVIVYQAESQSARAMGKQRFQESKDRVLHILSEMVGCDVDELRANATPSASAAAE